MQIHEIQPNRKQRRARRIGRGGKKGMSSGRGMKGQKSRAGHRMQPKVRELLKRYPKLRGSRRPTREKAITIKLAQLEKHFQAGEIVNPAVLAQKKIAGTIKGQMPSIKILGDGEITKALTIEKCALSKSAREKIVKAGGTIQ